MSTQVWNVMQRSVPRRRLQLATALIGVVLFAAQSSYGWYSDPSLLTLSGQIEHSHAVIFVERPKEGPAANQGATLYRVLDVLKDDRRSTSPGSEIMLDAKTGIDPGGTGLVLGSDDEKGRHWSPFPLSRDGWKYIRELPKGEQTQAELAAHFAPYIAYNERLIEMDAVLNLTQVEMRHVAKYVDDAMHARISERVAQKSVSPILRNEYGYVLGLIGNDDDRRVLREIALQQTSDYRIEADGAIAGYLALTGEEGLKELEDQKLQRPDVVFSEQYAVIKAIKFCFLQVPERIPRKRLGQTLLRTAVRLDLCDVAFGQLTQMNEWSGIESVQTLYDSQLREIPSAVRAMIRFVYVASHPELAKVEKPTPAQQQQATKLLEMFRDREPEAVEKVSKFFAPPPKNGEEPMANSGSASYGAAL